MLEKTRPSNDPTPPAEPLLACKVRSVYYDHKGVPFFVRIEDIKSVSAVGKPNPGDPPPTLAC